MLSCIFCLKNGERTLIFNGSHHFLYKLYYIYHYVWIMSGLTHHVLTDKLTPSP